MFIGREKELNSILNTLDESNHHIMIYGNRRIGKTTLVMEALKQKKLPCISFECLKGSLNDNLQSLTSKLSDLKLIPSYVNFINFEDLFKFLNTLNSRFIIFFDEYPYLYEFNKKEYIDSLFQKIIDTYCENINIIISGSHISMMKNLISNGSPLFGRFNLYLHLSELDYLEASYFYPNKSNYEKVAFYSVFGGSPFVLSLIDPTLDLQQNIKKTYLNVDSPLYMFLSEGLTTDFLTKDISKTIFKAIGNGKYRYNELESKLNINHNGLLSKQIKQLIEMEYIDKNYPINKKEDDKKATYYIKNNAIKFFYTYIYTNTNTIRLLGEDAFYKNYIDKSLLTFISYRFEDICKSFISKLVINGKINGVLDIGTYYYDDSASKQNSEFDIALKTNSGYSIFEAKYYNGTVDKQTITKELSQISNINEIQINQIGFISINGFDENLDLKLDYLFTGNDIYFN